MKGYFFSLLIALLLGFMITVSGYALVFRPSADVSSILQGTSHIAGGVAAREMALDFHVKSGGNSGMLVIQENRSAAALGALSGKIAEWGAFGAKYSEETNSSLYVDGYNASSWLGAGRMSLIRGNVRYEWDGNEFKLGHSSDAVNFTAVMPSVNYFSWSPALGNSGDVKVLIVIGNYTSGERWISHGTAYNGFFNFTTGGNMTLNFDAAGSLEAGYSNAPSTFSQSVGISRETGPLYCVFGGVSIDSTSTSNPGWEEPVYPAGVGATRHYGSAMGYNMILADVDNDGSYDSAFADVENDGSFRGKNDAQFLKNGTIADFSGKSFYITFANNGNWITLEKALSVRVSHWGGESISPVVV